MAAENSTTGRSNHVTANAALDDRPRSTGNGACPDRQQWTKRPAKDVPSTASVRARPAVQFGENLRSHSCYRRHASPELGCVAAHAPQLSERGTAEEVSVEPDVAISRAAQRSPLGRPSARSPSAQPPTRGKMNGETEHENGTARRRSNSAGNTFRNTASVDDCSSCHPPGSPPNIRRRIDQSVEMPKFDGVGDLELFLQRFDMLAEYYDWSTSEQLFRLKQCVQGDAQYVLIDTAGTTSVREFVKIMRDRFGAATHAERYRTELSRLRRGTMSIEQLHLKVRSLVSKAAPGPWTALTEVYARDAFLSALDDEELRRRILLTCPPPETLSAAYDLALRTLAIDTINRRNRERSPDIGKTRHARVLADGRAPPSEPSMPPPSPPEVQRLAEENRRMKQQIADLQSALHKITTHQLESKPSVEAGVNPVNRGPAYQPNRRDLCWQCHLPGNRRRDCVNRGPSATMTTAQPVINSNSRKASVLSSRGRPPAKVYLDIEYKGKKYRALMDTGCDLSVLGSKILPELSYQACETKLYAANATVVPILGTAVVTFGIAGTLAEYEFLVSDA